MGAVSIRELLESGVHFGHQTQRWNPKMKPYIFGAKNGIYIVDLQKTARQFDRAYRFLSRTVANGGKVMFVGTKKQAQDIIKNEAERCDMFYVNSRWLGGMLTNYRTIKTSVDRLNSLEKMREDGQFSYLTKKESLSLERQIAKLNKALGGIKTMKNLPAVLFVVDVKKERIAVHEAQRLNIPIVAVVDTNCDPDGVDYVIPGNDDALKAIGLFTSRIADACLEGQHLSRDASVRQLRESGEGQTNMSDVEVLKVRKGTEETGEETTTAEVSVAPESGAKAGADVESVAQVASDVVSTASENAESNPAS